MKCKICKKDTKIKIIDSYKHLWFRCKECKNIFSEKKVYKESKLKKLLVNLISKITKQNRIKKLLLNYDTSGNEFYNYTGNIPNNGGSHFPKKNSIHDKWTNYDNNFINYLKDNNVNLINKKILSVSDEPGLIVNELKKYTSKQNITLTSLDTKTSKLMSSKLNCKVLKFDLNNDYLSKIFSERFDLIFFRSTLNFNLDFVSLLNEVDKISNKDTKIIFNFHTPTTASCFMWMFDDYTLLSLVNIEYLLPVFEKKKFQIISSKKTTFNPRKFYYNTFSKKLFYYPFYYFYLIKYLLKNIFDKDKLEINKNEIAYKLILKKN